MLLEEYQDLKQVYLHTNTQIDLPFRDIYAKILVFDWDIWTINLQAM